jgi:hypothetical protein
MVSVILRAAVLLHYIMLSDLLLIVIMPSDVMLCCLGEYCSSEQHIVGWISAKCHSDIILRVVMLRVVIVGAIPFVIMPSGGCHNTKCCYTERHFADCRNARLHFAEVSLCSVSLRLVF